MSEVRAIDSRIPKSAFHRRSRTYLPKPYLAVCVAVSLTIIAILLYVSPWPSGNGPLADGEKPSIIPAFSLLSQACAAEQSLFSGDGIVHIVNEIVVEAVKNPQLAKMRWLPIVSLEASGKTRFHQLRLGVETDEKKTIKDQSWYDPASGRFSRVLTIDKRPIFANAYDGENIYLYLDEGSSHGAAKVVERPKSDKFQAPETPAQFLGIAAGLTSTLDLKDKSLFSGEGEVTLADGSKGRLVKISMQSPDGEQLQPNSYWLATIREDNKTIAKMDWKVEGKSLLVIQRVNTETVQSPAVPWNLAGIDAQIVKSGQKSFISIMPDMVVANETVAQMAKKADFQTYVFAKDPSWAGERHITDILDIVSPPKRMFMITYRAKDGRHVVLVQAPTYNKMIGVAIKEHGKVLYTSPNGIKVWTSSKDKFLAGILMQSARGELEGPPAKDLTGYVLETKEGTFPALAINGPITEGELHSLIDSLVPVKAD